MKIDTALSGRLEVAAPEAMSAESAGYDAAWVAETNNDPFLSLAAAATATDRIALGTAVAVAFARSPMTVAGAAAELQRASAGRITLGLGSQVRAHIERRFSMPWSQPARRMREYIAALHAIWDAWEFGTALDFRGDFYQHTLMTPFFTHDMGVRRPRVYLAAVGARMTEVAGEVADGLLTHAFTTRDYLAAVTLPSLEKGLATSGRSRSAVDVFLPVFVVSGSSDAERAASDSAARRQIAFYGSTPAYRAVLDHHGWGDLHEELHRLSRAGEWSAMGDAIDDEVLATFAVVAEPADAAARLLERFGPLVDRVSLYIPPHGGAALDRVVADLLAQRPAAVVS